MLPTSFSQLNIKHPLFIFLFLRFGAPPPTFSFGEGGGGINTLKGEGLYVIWEY